MTAADDDSHAPALTQRERFEQLAREAGADEDEARWDERLKKVARSKPDPRSEPEQ